MAGNKTRSSNKLVLDIGTSAIRLCDLSKTKTGYQLNKYYQRSFEIDPAMDEEAKQDKRATVLAEILKEAKVRAKKAVVAVPGQSVFTRNRSLPPVPEYKVPQIVRYEIQQQIPFSLDEISLDYQVLGRTDVGGYDVMMAAIKVDVVEKQIEILSKVKRGVETVDVSPLAAYNWLSFTGDFGNDGACVAMIDLGATTTDIVIQKDNQFKFTRSLHVGGNDITAAIASAFNMSFLEAERLKCEKAFAPTGNAEQDGRGGEVTGRVLSRLVGEINRSFAYYRSQPGGGPVARVVISGGGACLRNIIPYLQRQLNIEVRIAQPLAGVAVSPEANQASQFPEQACVVLGLALRSTQKVPVAINLIPPRLLDIARRKDELKYWVATFVVIFAIMASVIPKTKNQNTEVLKQIEHYKEVIGKYDAMLINNPNGTSKLENKMNILTSDFRLIKQEIQALEVFASHRNVWLEEVEGIYNARSTKGLAISSFQTIIIGDPGDLKHSLTGTDDATSDDDSSSNDRPRFRGNTGATADLMLTAFPGISSMVPDSSTAGGSRGSRGKDRDSSSTEAGGSSSSKRLPEPNGIAIFGYASNVKKVQEFVRLLEGERLFIENGVYFHISSLREVSAGELNNADLGTLKSATTGAGGGGRGGDSGGRGGRTTGGGRGGGGGSSTIIPGITGSSVVKFQIELQLYGKTSTFTDGEVQDE